MTRIQVPNSWHPVGLTLVWDPRPMCQAQAQLTTMVIETTLKSTHARVFTYNTNEQYASQVWYWFVERPTFISRTLC